MDYNSCYRVNGKEFELQHHGVKGMKWGVRKKRARHEDYQKAHSRKHVSEMSDKELRERNNRLQMEQQYAQLTKRKNHGARAIKAVIAGAGTLIALDNAIRTYKKYGNGALDKVGNWVIKSIDLSKPFA